MSNSLLPPNATPLERHVATALAEIQRVPVPLRQLWSPATCPAHLLPYLAWAFSVDRWDTTWSEATKRGVISAAFYVHQRKGTISALRRVVEPLGYLLEVDEWWQQQPQGAPGTFALRIGVLDTGITDAMYTELTRLVDDAKPLTRHITGLDLLGESRGTAYVGTTVYDGDVTAVYPFIAPESRVAGPFFVGLATDSIDTTTVYPQ
ncbi:phage tail protein, P2 protein I family [Modicisalibacter ilicicola DSM 19980]|uniref:Phage tail protein, P2 protein I family n=1 Tax=Modicisalibacter ilicicola DSM 19980 TaxID=1121942 RepID=A0A1M4Y3P0_9GAMM|nr:phage tail protein I [Halomonas ilicicola]SHF00308.1 phage tail protein, P2 protein I family [Halomonas ilicicola DSM 19980]